MSSLDRKLSPYEQRLLTELKNVVQARSAEAGPSAVRTAAGTSSRRWFDRRLAWGLAGMVAVGVGVVAPIAASTTDEPSALVAMPALADAAAVAEKQPGGTAPRDDQFIYSRTVGVRDEDDSERRCGYVHESWVAVDEKRPGRVVRADGVVVPRPQWRGDPKTLSAQPGCRREVFETDKSMQGNHGMPGMPEKSGSWMQPTKRFIAALPATPEALLQASIDDVLRERPDESESPDMSADRRARRYVYAFGNLAGLISSDSPHLTPQVRATTLRAMALVPGVRDLGPTKDLLGRAGIAFSAPEDGESLEDTEKYIIDPNTGECLGVTHGSGTSVTTTVLVDATERPSR